MKHKFNESNAAGFIQKLSDETHMQLLKEKQSKQIEKKKLEEEKEIDKDKDKEKEVPSPKIIKNQKKLMMIEKINQELQRRTIMSRVSSQCSSVASYDEQNTIYSPESRTRRNSHIQKSSFVIRKSHINWNDQLNSIKNEK